MEQQLAEFIAKINAQVGIVSDDSVRKQNEQQMQQLKDSQPDLFIQLLLAALKTAQDVHVRTYCASSLRKNLSEYSEGSFKNLWTKLQAPTQQQFKTQIFECLDGESSSNVRNLISDCIGEVGASLVKPLEENATNQWPEVIDLLWQLFASDRNPILESAFKILANMLLYIDELFTPKRAELKVLFQNGLANQDVSIKVAAMQAIGSFIGTIEPKELGKYEDLNTPIFNTTLEVMAQDEDSGESMLEVIADLAEEEPKFYKKSFGMVFNAISKIFHEKNIENSSIKRTCIEILVLIIERFPSTIKSSQDHKKNLIEMIFMFMIDMDEDIDEKWQKPAEGFREAFNEDADNANTQFGMSSIDRLMESVGQDKLMATLSETIQNLLQHQDWRYVFAALMALSQIGEFLEDVSDLLTIMPVIFKFFEHPNAKIRYAAFHCVGQISDDMQPEFQQKFHSSIFPLFVKSLDDPVPRVVSHALAAMTNYMEGVDKDMIQPYLEETLKKSFVLLQNGISLVKENAISNIAALAEAASSDFSKYYQECIPLIFSVYQQYPGKEYKQLRGCVVEAITVIGDAIEKEQFLPYLNDTVALILKIQDSDLDQIDPQKNFVLTGWSRICQKYNKEFVQYLPQVIPSVVKVIQQIINHTEAIENGTEEQQDSGHTYQHNEATIAMNMLELFIEKLGNDLGPYIQQFVELLLPLCQFKGDEDIRSQASRCLPGLIQCVVETNKSVAIDLVKQFIQIMYGAAESEYDAETITHHIQGMKGCIEAVGQFLSQEELNQLSQKIIELLMQSDKRKEGNNQLAKEEDVEDEEKALYELDTTSEEQLHVAIAELLGILFKTHADLCSELSELMYNKFLPTVLADNVSDRMHQFGIFLVDDMIEFLKFSRVSDKWQHLAEALAKFACSKDCKVRQATVYGIGIFAEETPANEFPKYSQTLLEVLVKALDIPQQENQTLKTFTHCTDNTIASIGKILKTQWANVQSTSQVVDFWLRKLPLKKDKEEAHIQHQLLCDFVMDGNTNAVLFANQENYKLVVQVFAKILGTKVCTPAIKESVKKCMGQLATLDLVKNNWNQIIEGLTEDQQNNLKEVC